MAKPKPGNNRQNEVVYLRCDLDKSSKDKLKEWIKSDHNYFDMIEKSVDSGLRFSCSFDAFNECFQAALTKVANDEKPPMTYVLVGRGGTLLQAMQAVFYKHYVILDTEWSELGKRDARKETDWS